MCRNPALAATAQMPAALLGALTVLLLKPALAWSAAPPAAPLPAASPPVRATPPAPRPPAATAPEARPKAPPEIRAQAERLDPLSRAAFWASQVDADPKDPEAGVKLASALRALGRYPEAYNAAQAVLVVQPGNVEALLETARAAIAGNEGFYAIEPARKAMQAAPRDWRAASLLAVGLDQAKRPAEALEAHRKALQLAPQNPVVLSNAALFYAAQGDRTQAESLLRKAAGQPGASVQVRQNLALVLGLEGKLAEAEQIERQDLPPQMAQANLDYFKAAGAR